VLFLTQVLPYPLDAGPKVRAYHMLRHLAARHDVTLASFVRSGDTAAAIDHLAGICTEVHTVSMQRSWARNVGAGVKGLLTGLPIVVARDEIGAMASTLRSLVRRLSVDVVHADQTSMAGYGQMAATSARRRPATLLDQHNAIHQLSARMAAETRQPFVRQVMRREARAFARYEAAMCRAYDAVLTVTAADRDHLLALYPPPEREQIASRFTVVPICVDPALTSPVAPRPKAPGEPPVIFHLGTMFWPPNVAGVLWFAGDVLPIIHRSRPDARFVIAGKDPPPAVMALAADPRITVTGYVADPTPYLAEADAFVVPLAAGSGMRVKILDAWLWGLPVVSTTLGAEGIDVHPGDDILLADDPAAFAHSVLRLLADGDLNQRLRRQGRAWVEAHYSYTAVYRQVDNVYDRLLSGKM